MGKKSPNCTLPFTDFCFSSPLFPQPLTGYGLIKFSVPQPAGRQSVEVVSVAFSLSYIKGPVGTENTSITDWKSMFGATNNLLEHYLLSILCYCSSTFAVLPLWLQSAKGKNFTLILQYCIMHNWKTILHSTIHN